MKYAKVINCKIETINGTEHYYAFRTGKRKNTPAMICGHYSTLEEAEIAAKSYRTGVPAEKLILKQTKNFITQ